MPGELAEGILGKYLGYKPHLGIYLDTLAVGGGDTGAFLATMLESEKGKKGKPSYIFIMGIDPKNATSLVQIRLPLRYRGELFQAITRQY